MNTSLTGAITGNRRGAVAVQQSYMLDNLTPATGVAVKLCTIDASPTRPVSMRLVGVVMTPSDAVTSHTVSVGIDAGAGLTAYLAAVNAKAAVNTNYKPASDVVILQGATDIWYQQTIVGGITTGKFALTLQIAELNIQAPAQGS